MLHVESEVRQTSWLCCIARRCQVLRDSTDGSSSSTDKSVVMRNSDTTSMFRDGQYAVYTAAVTDYS